MSKAEQELPLGDALPGAPPLVPRDAALVFISHDSRDAAIAEAFASLLAGVSAGVLKTFRSSDRRATRGIEYGIEWYEMVMQRLRKASDVVCLLTSRSIDRPWILFEAGVAKGKDTPVYGLAIGISLDRARTGPFAQLQNTAFEVDTIADLVIQLLGRVPGADPERDMVRIQVEAFVKRVEPLLPEQPTSSQDEADSASTAQLFEEVKAMYGELPKTIDQIVGKGYQLTDVGESTSPPIEHYFTS